MRLGCRKKRRRSRPASAAIVRITTPAPCRSAWRTRRPASGGWWRWRRAGRAGTARRCAGPARGRAAPPRRRRRRRRGPRAPAARVIVARSSSGCSPRTRTTSPATWARSSSGVPVAATRPPSRMAMRWQRSASSGWCVVTMTLVPRAAASAAISSQIRRSASGSTPRPGLVQQQQRRLVQQHARDLDAPAHAARIRRRGLVGAIAQRHQRQRLVDAPGRQRARHAVERGAEPQVLARGQLEIEARLLEHHAQARAVGGVGGRRPAGRRAPASRRARAAGRPAGGTRSSCRRRWGRAGRTARRARPRS